MSGVGSTNAMKKGSANNPFLAFSEADMKGYLNSAYTGCIVKYTGDPIARKITFETANVPERAQNLVFTRNAPTFGDYGFGDLVITKKQNGSTTTEYLRCAYCNLLTGLIGPLSSGTPSGDNYVKFIGLFSSNINTSNRNLIRACWVPDAIDSKYEYPDWWPVTPGWQEDFVNTEGKVVEWGYGEDVVFTYSGDSDAVLLLPCVITPYEVGELYKVVYSNNEYRYEEFHCISEDKTTAGVEDVAPGKTFYDFAGTKQIGTGTRANPFLARSNSDMNAFNNATYLGKFVKYIGKTNDTYVKDAIYQVTNDATEYDRYMLLPTLENEGTAIDLAKGKQLINSQGEVVEGDAPAQGDVLALYANKQLTEFVTDEEIYGIGYNNSNVVYNKYLLNFSGQSMLTKVICPNLKNIATYAFYDCPKLSYISIPYSVSVHYLSSGYRDIFPSQMRISTSRFNAGYDTDGDGVIDFLAQLQAAESINCKVILPYVAINKNITSLSFLSVINICDYAMSSMSKLSKLYIPACEYIGISAFANASSLSEVHCPNLKRVYNGAFKGCSKLSSIDLDNLEYADMDAFNNTLVSKSIFNKVTYYKAIYGYTGSLVSQINLPLATHVEEFNYYITDLSIPEATYVRIYSTSSLKELNLPKCVSLPSCYAQNLSILTIPNVKYAGGIFLPSLLEFNAPNLTNATDTSLYLNLPVCTKINIPKYNHNIRMTHCDNINEFTVGQSASFSIYNTYVTQKFLETVVKCKTVYASSAVSASTSFSVTINESYANYLSLSIYTTNNASIDFYLGSKYSYFDDSTFIGINGNAINNVYFDVPYVSSTANVPFKINCKKLQLNGYCYKSICDNATNLQELSVSNTGVIPAYTFRSCGSLSQVFISYAQSIEASAFYNCSKLETFILTRFVSLRDANVFYNTPIRESTYLGYYGSIYVPNSLISQYRSVYPWSYYSSRITSITDLPQELKDKYGLNGVE